MDVQVVVEAGESGLVVSWTGHLDELFISESPDEPGNQALDLDGESSLAVGQLDPSVRHYVHARLGDRWVVAAERLVPLEGTLNFRDLGGYRVGDGRQVRWGRVFRSDGLGALTDTDRHYLEALGIKTVCDLRDPKEHDERPSLLPPSIQRLSHAIPPSRPGQRTLDERIVAGEVERLGIDDVVDLYLLMIEEYAPSFGGVLEHIAGLDRQPVVFHCAAGKDRTGIVAALLLSLLGVDDDDVFDDYMLTLEYRSRRRRDEIEEWLAGHGLTLAPFEALYVPQRDTIVRTLEAIRGRHGSVDEFVIGPAGASPDTPDRLRARLLVDPSSPPLSGTLAATL